MYSFLGKTLFNCDEVLYIEKPTCSLDYIVKMKNGTEVKIPNYDVKTEQLKQFGKEQK